MNRTPRPFDLSFLFADVSQTHLGLVPLLAGLLLVATGCSSTHQVSRTPSDGYARVTEAATGETARVHFRDGRTMKLDNLYVGPDSTTGLPPDSGQDRSFPTPSLQKIELVDRGAGFWQGAGVGLGLGLMNGVVGAASSDDDLLGPAAGFVIGLATGIPLSLVGGLFGAASGQRDVYRFPEHSSRMDPAAVSPRDEIEAVRRRGQ